jgi:hypothetical protein
MSDSQGCIAGNLAIGTPQSQSLERAGPVVQAILRPRSPPTRWGPTGPGLRTPPRPQFVITPFDADHNQPYESDREPNAAVTVSNVPPPVQQIVVGIFDESEKTFDLISYRYL